jgi:hypothetical protein
MDVPFALRYLETIGAELSLHERAKAGKLHDFVTDEILANLIAEGVAPPPRLLDEIRHAGYVGHLKARTIPGGPGVPVTTGGIRGDIRTAIVNETDAVYIIHRDDARRYFAALDLVPLEGSALHCWLYRKANGARQLRPEQQDKADFQQLCIDHWERSRASAYKLLLQQ